MEKFLVGVVLPIGRFNMNPDNHIDDRDVGRRPVLGALAAGGAAGLAGCSSLVNSVPIGDAAAADEVLYDGLRHAAIGDASLAVEDEELVVSTGEEGGVRSVFGTVGAASIGFAPFDLGEEGRRFEFSGAGTVGGESGRPIGTAALRGTGDTIEAGADYSEVGSEAVRVQVLDGQEVVADTVVEGGGVVAEIEPGPRGLPRLHHCYKDITPDFPLPCWRPIWDRDCVVTAIDGTEGRGNRLRLLAADGEELVENLQAFDLVAGGASGFRLRDVSVGLFGNLHSGIGEAVLETQYPESRLGVGNVETGAEGVSVNFGGVSAASVSFDPVDLGERGRRFDVAGTGTVDGEAGQSIGQISLGGTGDAIEAVADYSDVGSETVRVQVVRSGEVVGETVVPGGDIVATVEPGPEGLPRLDGCDKDIRPDPPFPPIPCYVPVCDRIGRVVASDGTELAGDRIRLLADEPERSLESIDTFDLTAAGVGEFTVAGESTTPLG